MAIGHFLTNITILAEQNLIAKTNLLYISYGEAIIMFLLLINGRPISNPYFKLCQPLTVLLENGLMVHNQMNVETIRPSRECFLVFL